MPSQQDASASSRSQNARAATLVRVAVVLAAALLALATGLVLHVAVRQADALERAHEEQLAANALRARVGELQEALSTETLWDAAVANLDNSWNDGWARANLVQWESNTFQLIRVYDAAGRTRLRHADGLPAAAEPQVERIGAELVTRIRRREALRGPFAARAHPSATLISKPIQESTAAVIDGRLYLFTACLVQPDFGAALPHARAPVVVAAARADDRFLRAFADGLLLKGLVVKPKDAVAAPDQARIPVKDADGATQAYLGWRPDSPAQALVRALWWPVAACRALLVVAVAALLWVEARYRHSLQRERDRAEQASQAKSRFLANMSHEIRTPLNGVMGMAQLMNLGELSDTQRDQLGVVLRSGKMLTAVLNDVLDISKIEAGQMVLEPHEFDLAECLETACRPFTGAAEEKGLAFEIIVSPEARGRWVGDEARIRQILANLCANAVKFTAKGGVEVVAGCGGEGLRIAVRDSGIGIPADRLGSLFKEFSQVDASITRSYGGSGLGLAISRRLAELMEGALSVQSTLGEGSAFTLELPLRRAGGEPAPEAAPAETPLAAADGLRVLAADDNAVNRRILQAVLEPACSALVLVQDGTEAVEAFRSGAFDVVLMDIQMPRQDGLSASREIRAWEALHGVGRTPILALTANVMTEQLAEYGRAGMDGHIGKPIDFAELFAAVNRALTPPPDVRPPAAVRQAS